MEEEERVTKRRRLEIEGKEKKTKERGYENVSALEIFNLPLFEDYLVIDLRAKELYDAAHIDTALSFPFQSFETEKSRLGGLPTFFSDVLHHRGLPEHTSPIILYASPSFPSDGYEWMAQNILSLQESLPSSSLRFTKPEFWVLQNGFEEFQTHFPILVRSSQTTLKEMPPLPCAMSYGLFLGSRSVESLERRAENRLALPQSILRELGIRYVIVDALVDLNYEDAVEFECLRFSEEIVDGEVPYEKMKDVWDQAIALIESVLERKENILVQFYGRSRSAAIMAAWAIRTKKLGWQEAVEFVQRKCFYRLDQGLMYLDHLRRYSEEKHRAIEHPKIRALLEK